MKYPLKISVWELFFFKEKKQISPVKGHWMSLLGNSLSSDKKREN